VAKWVLLGLGLAAGLFALGLSSGSYPIPLSQVWQVLWQGQGDSPASTVIWQLRLPRLLLAILVGAALSAAGAAFQSLLRSPLADPYLIGTSAGASLGTALSVVLGLATYLQPAMAFLGALASVWLVMRLSRAHRVLYLEDFLLAGVMVSTLLGSLVSVLLIWAGQDLAKLVFFLLGNLGQSSWSHLYSSTLPFAVGLALLAWNAYSLNLLSLGEEFAAPAGVDVEAVKRQVLLAATLLTASAVSAAGLVGFVGLVIPHLCRLWVGPDLRRLLPLSFLWGATFLMGCDQLARLGSNELPVGVVTAVLGAPWFLWQLQSHRRVRV